MLFLKRLLLLIFIAPISLSGQWTRTGDVIFQTGTSNSLAGLEAINGVTTETQGSKIVYHVEDTDIDYIQIDGTLQIDPKIEALVFTTNVVSNQAILVNGTLRIGVEEVLNNVTRYSKGMALTMPKRNRNQSQIGSLRVSAGGRFEWRGGTIYSGNAMGAGIGGTAEIWDGIFVNTDNDASAMFFRNDGDPDDLIVHNITLDSNTPPDYGSIIFSRDGLNNFSATILAGQIQPRGGPFAGPLSLSNLKFKDNVMNADMEFIGTSGHFADDEAQGVEITNIDVGTSFRVIIRNNDRSGHVAIFQEVNIHCIDENGAALEDVRVFLRTKDHGNRLDVASEKLRNYRSFTGTDFDIYTAVTDATGYIPMQKVLTGTKYNEDFVNPAVTTNLYGNHDVEGEDLFTFHLWHYNKAQASLELELKASNAITGHIELLPDSNISETDPDVVAAFTHIENLDELYDYAKYWKTLEANVEIPAANELILKTNGRTLDLGEYNLVIDPTAAEIFAVDTASKTITIRNGTSTSTDTTEKPIYSGTKFAEVLTTGLVTSNDNDNIVRFGFQDSSGINLHLEIKHLENTTVEVVDFAGVPDGQPGTVLSASDGPFTGTYEATFVQPADASNIQIKLHRFGYEDFIELFPEESHSFILDPILIETDEYVDNQRNMLAYLEKIIQKLESVNQRLLIPENLALPTVTLNLDEQAGIDEGDLALQRRIMFLIEKILVKTLSIHQSTAE